MSVVVDLGLDCTDPGVARDGGKRNRLSVDVQLDVEASAPDFVEQCVEAVGPG